MLAFFLPFMAFFFSSFRLNLLSFPVFIPLFLLYFLINANMGSMQTAELSSSIVDETCVFIVFMTCIVLYVSFFWSPFSSMSGHASFVSFFMLVFCVGVFASNSLFFLYLFYEASLVPILYIILKWGSYPERSVSAIMLLLYTAIFSIPFVYGLFFIYSSFFTFSYSSVAFFDFSVFNYGVLLSFIVFLTFAVNLPVYGLHFWLPMAHVEAPTFGSIILAGVLLKLGGLGLVRFSPFLSSVELTGYLLSYGLVFMIFVTVVCCLQSDFKRLIAYSSVSHIIAIPLLLLVGGSVSSSTLVMLMMFHGLSSPALFILVGVCYSLFGSRQMVFVRGIFLLSPLLSILYFLAFLFTLSAPPFASFVSEVFFFISCLSLTSFSLPFLFVFAFLSLVYNVNWLSSITFSSSFSSNQSYVLSYLSFLTIFFTIVMSFPFLFLIPLF